MCNAAGWRTHKQSDGKEITYMLCGDEHCHYYMSADSFVLKRNPTNGDFEYLQRNQQRVRPAEMRNAKPIQQPIQSRSRKTAYTGKKKGLFILVEFDDIKFSRADIKAVYDSICNMKGYHTGQFVGSVHDYFLEQSDGKFDLTFDVVGPVTMSKSESYYGSNSSWGVDVNISEMVLETLIRLEWRQHSRSGVPTLCRLWRGAVWARVDDLAMRRKVV